MQNKFKSKTVLAPTLTLTLLTLTLAFAGGCADQRSIAKEFSKLQRENILAKQKVQDDANARAASDSKESVFHDEITFGKIQDCRDVSALHDILTKKMSTLYTAGSISLIDAILIPYGKNICEPVKKELRLVYAGTDVEDILNDHIIRLERLNADDLFQLRRDDPTIIFPAKQIFPLASFDFLASEVQNGKVEITGVISTSDKKLILRVVAILETRQLKDVKKPTLVEIVSAVGEKAVSFQVGKSGKIEGLVEKSRFLADKNLTDIIEGLGKEARIEAKAIEKRRQNPGALNFELAQASAIDQAGNDLSSGSTEAILKTHLTTKGQEIAISDVDLSEADRIALGQYFGEKSNQAVNLKQFAFEGFPSDIDSIPPVFWVKNSKCGPVAYVVSSPQKADKISAENSVVLDFTAYLIPSTTELQPLTVVKEGTHEPFEAGFQLDKKLTFDKLKFAEQVRIKMGFSSALWLKLQTERIMQNLIKKGIADQRASRASLKAYTLYSFLKNTKNLRDEDSLCHN